MNQQSIHVADAQRLGYPAGVCGYAPHEQAYWVEPTLGWVNELLNPHRYGIRPDKARAKLARLFSLPRVWNENMAPRFPDGTWLIGKELAVGSPVAVGRVLCFWEPGDAPDCPTFARVVRLHRGELRLSCDNGGRAYCLPWGVGDAAQVGPVYRVTHYSTLPFKRG